MYPRSTRSAPGNSYPRQMAVILAAAFTLSVVHTGYAWLNGLENPDFTVTSPVTWAFYGLAFAMTALALREEVWAQVVVQTFLVLCLGVAIFVYPRTFEPHQQTVFGWFENDVYVGLLFIATYLGALRLRGAEGASREERVREDARPFRRRS